MSVGRLRKKQASKDTMDLGDLSCEDGCRMVGETRAGSCRMAGFVISVIRPCSSSTNYLFVLLACLFVCPSVSRPSIICKTSDKSVL